MKEFELPEIATKKQRVLFKYGLEHPYSILAAQPRLGKSATAIWLQQARNANCLIVCPSYLTFNWKKEIEKWSPRSIITLFKSGKEIYEVVDSDFVIISYDLAQKAEHLFGWATMVVADEIHHLKSIQTKRSDFFHRALYENSVKYFHGLTGTPLKNRVREFYSLIALTYYDPRLNNPKFLDIYSDEILFAERFSYRSEFYVGVKTKKGRVFDKTIVKYEGLRNKSELKKWLKGRYIRILADNNDLPPFSYKDILLSEKTDKKLWSVFEAFLNGEDSHLVRPDIKRDAAVKKTPFTIKYVDSLLEEVECCLVYSDHKEPVYRMAKHFNVPAITGDMPSAKRSRLAKEFQEGKFSVLCATIGSLKEGEDLFRAKDVVFNDICWVPGDLKQVIDRTRALGEKEPRLVHRILGSPQDKKIYKALEEKQKTIDAATN